MPLLLSTSVPSLTQSFHSTSSLLLSTQYYVQAFRAVLTQANPASNRGAAPSSVVIFTPLSSMGELQIAY